MDEDRPMTTKEKWITAGIIALLLAGISTCSYVQHKERWSSLPSGDSVSSGEHETMHFKFEPHTHGEYDGADSVMHGFKPRPKPEPRERRVQRELPPIDQGAVQYSQAPQSNKMGFWEWRACKNSSLVGRFFNGYPAYPGGCDIKFLTRGESRLKER